MGVQVPLGHLSDTSPLPCRDDANPAADPIEACLPADCGRVSVAWLARADARITTGSGTGRNSRPPPDPVPAARARLPVRARWASSRLASPSSQLRAIASLNANSDSATSSALAGTWCSRRSPGRAGVPVPQRRTAAGPPGSIQAWRPSSRHRPGQGSVPATGDLRSDLLKCLRQVAEGVGRPGRRRQATKPELRPPAPRTGRRRAATGPRATPARYG